MLVSFTGRFAARPLARLASALLCALALCAVFASSRADALVSGKFGLQTRAPVPIETEPLQYHGGPIVPASDTYAIYWDPLGAYRPDWMTQIDRYLHDVGAASGQLSNVFSLDGQYTGPGGTRASYESTFRGAYTDTTPYPENGPPTGCEEPKGARHCLSNGEIEKELKDFVQAHGLPTGTNVVYFVLTPPEVTVCTDTGEEKGTCSVSDTSSVEEAKGITNGFCGYHSAIEPTSASPIVYAVQPWVAGNAGEVITQLPLATESATPAVLACENGSLLVEPNQTGGLSPFGDYETGLADVIVNDLSVEQNDIVVNPLLNGWYQASSNAEQSDMCQRQFIPAPEPLPTAPSSTKAISLSDQHINGDNYYLQWGFSSVGVTSGKGIVCWEDTVLAPHYTAPNPVNVGDVVGFDANESNIALDANTTKTDPVTEPFTAPVYAWDFGDGTPAVSGTGLASVFHSYSSSGNYHVTLTVTDSAGNKQSFDGVTTVLSPGGAQSGSSGQAGGGQSAAASTGAAPGSTPLPTPTLVESVVSRSLKKATRLGLAVRYKVDEQVAGRAEALLESATAARLHIKAPLATGLPKGYPSEVVVGTAVLVTTRAGQGTVRVRFSKTIAKRLAKARRVKLTLRFVLRSASRPPHTTTALSSIVLSK